MDLQWKDSRQGPYQQGYGNQLPRGSKPVLTVAQTDIPKVSKPALLFFYFYVSLLNIWLHKLALQCVHACKFDLLAELLCGTVLVNTLFVADLFHFTAAINAIELNIFSDESTSLTSCH